MRKPRVFTLSYRDTHAASRGELSIKLTTSEQERFDVIRDCIDENITNKEAAIRLGLKVRQVQNIKHAVKEDDKRGIIHKSKGRIPPNATPKTTVRKITAFLAEKKHQDFGPTFAQEKLANIGISMNPETLRLLMIKEKIWKSHPRHGPQIVREWRERKECFGELVQFDGSYHDWLETGDEECLLAAIDDATGKIVHAVIEDNEGVLAVFRFWKAYIEACGLPVAIYLDKFSTYKVNHKNAVDNAELITQFKRAMMELDIRVICANSPEAKGRIERLFGTLQDRMVKEMRLADIKTSDEANMYIYEKYIPDHNNRFSVPAKNINDAHRPLSDELQKKLPGIFSIQSKRVVNNDYTIQFKTMWFQLKDTQKIAVYKRDRVVIEERLDGTIHIRLKDTYLEYKVLPARPKPTNVPIVAITTKKPTRKPPKDHPWRRFNF
jgi:transposase-like protein